MQREHRVLCRQKGRAGCRDRAKMQGLTIRMGHKSGHRSGHESEHRSGHLKKVTGMQPFRMARKKRVVSCVAPGAQTQNSARAMSASVSCSLVCRSILDCRSRLFVVSGRHCPQDVCSWPPDVLPGVQSQPVYAEKGAAPPLLAQFFSLQGCAGLPLGI